MRKEKVITIEDIKDDKGNVIGESRDKGKRFLIVEMSAYDAEKLSSDLLYGLSQSSGIEIDPEVIALGMVGLKTLGSAYLNAMPRDLRDELDNRLLDCVYIYQTVSDARIKMNPRTDIEEWNTLRVLKDEVFNIHFDFLARPAN